MLTILVYFDANGTMGGKSGCFRAKLKERTGIHDAGQTKDEAVRSLLRTAKTFNLSDKLSDYRVESAPEVKPMDPYKTTLVLKCEGKEIGRTPATRRNAAQYIEELSSHYLRQGKSVEIEYVEDENAGLVASLLGR